MCVLAAYLVEGWHLGDDDRGLMVRSVMLRVRAEKKHLCGLTYRFDGVYI